MDSSSCYALCDAGMPGGWLFILVSAVVAVFARREYSWRGRRRSWREREHHLQSLIPRERNSEPTKPTVIIPETRALVLEDVQRASQLVAEAQQVAWCPSCLSANRKGRAYCIVCRGQMGGAIDPDAETPKPKLKDD